MIDTRISDIINKEAVRQQTTIELIASENFTSPEVMELCGSILTNKYAEGLPGKRYYNGCEHVDEVENLAIEYATQLFNCKFANVQPHSGAAKVNASGKWFNAHSYGVDDNGLIDYDSVAELVAQVKPKMLIAGASAYSQVIDWRKFRKIADSVGAILLADISHYSGLIAAEEYPNPFPHAHVATTTTHKTLRGPRGGMILWNDESYNKKINGAVFPGTQGGPLMHIIAAKAQCFHEALQPEFKVYAKRIKINANAMARTFLDANVDIVSGGTHCHMMTINLNKEKYSGREFADLLEQNGITVNKNGVPNDTRGFIETSGIRIGVAAETTRGHDERWFKELAERIINLLRNGD